ncbi:MAG: hypothetical protein SEPTF4163_005114 [Sporothrix epigloea]
MAAIDTSALIARGASTLAKRSNWAKHEAGVIVVFCIVGIVGIGLVSLWLHKLLTARKVARAANQK